MSTVKALLIFLIGVILGAALLILLGVQPGPWR